MLAKVNVDDLILGAGSGGAAAAPAAAAPAAGAAAAAPAAAAPAEDKKKDKSESEDEDMVRVADLQRAHKHIPSRAQQITHTCTLLRFRFARRFLQPSTILTHCWRSIAAYSSAGLRSFRLSVHVVNKAFAVHVPIYLLATRTQQLRACERERERGARSVYSTKSSTSSSNTIESSFVHEEAAFIYHHPPLTSTTSITCCCYCESTQR